MLVTSIGCFLAGMVLIFTALRRDRPAYVMIGALCCFAITICLHAFLTLPKERASQDEHQQMVVVTDPETIPGTRMKHFWAGADNVQYNVWVPEDVLVGKGDRVEMKELELPTSRHTDGQVIFKERTRLLTKVITKATAEKEPVTSAP